MIRMMPPAPMPPPELMRTPQPAMEFIVIVQSQSPSSEPQMQPGSSSEQKMLMVVARSGPPEHWSPPVYLTVTPWPGSAVLRPQMDWVSRAPQLQQLKLAARWHTLVPWLHAAVVRPQMFTKKRFPLLSQWRRLSVSLWKEKYG